MSSDSKKISMVIIKTVHTEYVALLNNDAVSHPLWLQSLMGAVDSCPEAGFAASKMVFYDNPTYFNVKHQRSGHLFQTFAKGPLFVIPACLPCLHRQVKTGIQNAAFLDTRFRGYDRD